MTKKRGIDTVKIKKQNNCRKYAVRDSGCALQYYVSQDVKKNKNAPVYCYNDMDAMEKGIRWFESGLTLNDAPDEMKNNVSFIAGFNRAYRVKLINDTLYNTGREYFEKGILLENISEKYRNNQYFMHGYNDAMSKRKQR